MTNFTNRRLLIILGIVSLGFGVYALHNYIILSEISDYRIGNIVSFVIYLSFGIIFWAFKDRLKIPSNIAYLFLIVALIFDSFGVLNNRLLFPAIVPINSLFKIIGFYLGYNVLKRTRAFYVVLLTCIPIVLYLNLIYLPRVEYSEQNNNFVPQLKQVNYALLRTQAGDSIDRRSLKGKVVLLDFYFMNCKPCLEKFPALEKLKLAFSGRNDVEFIGVYCDLDNSLNKLPLFLEKYKISITTYIDKDLKLCKELGINSYPLEIILNRKGEIASTYWGFKLDASDKYYKERIKLINDLLKAR